MDGERWDLSFNLGKRRDTGVGRVKMRSGRIKLEVLRGHSHGIKSLERS